MARTTTPGRIARSLTMLRAFVLLSGILLALGAFVLGLLLTGALRGQALDDAKLSLTQYTNGALGPHVVRDGRIAVSPAARDRLAGDLEARPDILSVKVWRADGVLAWTNLEPERIGKRFPLGHHLEEALESGLAEAEFESLGEAEDEAESRLGIDNVVEVYAPIRTGKRIVGAYEIYSDAAPVERSIAGHKRQIWIGTAAVFGALWVLLFLLVRGASRVLRRQTDTLRERSQALMDSYRRLEESSLEAVESLNATVEAKDPYTAGHSQRVQELALALGEHLQLGPQSLDALRFGALFHDIGKLAVPDSVLTKPDRLTPDEYELIKRHSADGAHIVGKLGRLRPAVPLVHHHHERWDGDGYPDRLAGDEIPVEAAIVGLCDAWDAMTTDRPYHRALSFDEAFAEVRRGRGSQFHPGVVDAFVELARQGRVRSGSEPQRTAGPVLAEAG